ncbi:MAG: hypothetical protein JKX76_14960 [Colwellia sp.]|nr:hypothetical protein [Colwellia sp.]
MAGGNIHCGTYEAAEKSGSAFEGVIDEIRSSIEVIAENFDRQLEEGEYVLILPKQAKKLIETWSNYRSHLINEIGNEDFDQEILREENAGMDPVDAKWGKNRGWRLYCVTDLLGACQAYIRENEPVCIAFS